jgi:hypothetical protein
MATVIVQPPILDTTIVQNAPDDTTYGTEDILWLNGYTATYVIGLLLKFTLSSVPSINNILSATVSVYCSTYADNIHIDCYRVLRAWDETATWNKYSGANSWGTAGCNNTSTDRSSTSMGDTHLTGTGWLDYPLNLTEFGLLLASNNGIMLRGSDTGNDSQFYAREYATDTTLRPKLTVVYRDIANPVAYLSDYGVI